MTTTAHDPAAAPPPRPLPPAGAGLGFARLGLLGRTSWKRHLAAIVVILASWFVLGTAAAVAVFAVVVGEQADIGAPLPFYLAVNAPFPFLLAGVAVAVRGIHRRPLRTLVTSPGRRVDRRAVALGFAFFATLGAAGAVVEALLHPGRYQLVFEPLAWLALLPVVLVVTTVQTSAEELLFRGWLLQAVGLLTRRTWLLVAVNGLLFALPHALNAEVAVDPVAVLAYMAGFGALMAYATVRSGGLELALGAHAANNLFVALVANYAGSSLPTSAIWSVDTFDPWLALAMLAVAAALFVPLVHHHAARRACPDRGAPEDSPPPMP
jgi:uncharacterized protein